MKRLPLLLAVFLVPCLAWAGGTVITVTIEESNVGVQIVDSIGGGLTVTNPSGGGAVYLARLTGTCSTDLTAARGRYLAAAASYDFLSSQDQWHGQVCGILASGSTNIVLEINTW